AAAFQPADQVLSDSLLADVQRRDLPGLRQGPVRPNRMQLIAFGDAAGTAAKASVGVFAVATDRQRLAVHKGQQDRTAAVAQSLLQRLPQETDAYAVDASADRRGRGQTFGLESRCTPVPCLAG